MTVADRWREIGPTARRLTLTGAGIGWTGLTLTDGVWTIATCGLGAAVAGLGVMWSQSTDGPARRSAETVTPLPDPATDPGPDDEPHDDAPPSSDVVTAVVRVGSTPPVDSAHYAGGLWEIFPAPDPVVLWLRRELAARGWVDNDPLDVLAAALVDVLRSAGDRQLTALTGRQVTALEAPDHPQLATDDRLQLTPKG